MTILKFQLGKLEAKDIHIASTKAIAGDYSYILKSQIDSIINNVRLYEPSPISNNDIFIETTKEQLNSNILLT